MSDIASSPASPLMRWLKRQGELAVAAGALIGVLSAMIVFFGGSLPPWYTPAKAAEDQRTNAKIQEQTVHALGQVTAQLNGLQRRLDIQDCNAFGANLLKALQALRKDPFDPVAVALRDTAQLQMRQIQNCAP